MVTRIFICNDFFVPEVRYPAPLEAPEHMQRRKRYKKKACSLSLLHTPIRQTPNTTPIVIKFCTAFKSITNTKDTKFRSKASYTAHVAARNVAQKTKLDTSIRFLLPRWPIRLQQLAPRDKFVEGHILNFHEQPHHHKLQIKHTRRILEGSRNGLVPM